MSTVEEYILSLNTLYAPVEWSNKSSCVMVLAPQEVLQAMYNYDDAGFNDGDTQGEQDLFLEAFQEANHKGEVYTYSIALSKYIKPISIVRISPDDRCVEIETQPGKIRKYRFRDICSTSGLNHQ